MRLTKLEMDLMDLEARREVVVNILSFEQHPDHLKEYKKELRSLDRRINKIKKYLIEFVD